MKKLTEIFFKCDFEKVFNDFTPHIKTHFHHNTAIINLKRYLLCWTECFIDRGQNFSHNKEINNTTIKDEMNMTFGCYNKHPMQAVDLRLHMIIAKNPHLINSLGRYSNHPFIKKYSHKLNKN